MRSVMRRAAICAAAVLGIVSLADRASANCGDWSGCGPNEHRYDVRVRCNKAEVENAETADTLTVTAWNGSQRLDGLDTSVGVICSRWYDPNRENAYFNLGEYDVRPTHFILETSGSDAFFADWVEIYETSLDKYGAPVADTRIAQYGAPGGRGYCLSRDPADHNGSWAAASDACDPAIKLNLRDSAVYEARPTDLAEWSILLDCVHSGLKNTLPWAPITIAVYDSAGRLVAQHTQSHGYDDMNLGNDLAARLDQALTCNFDEGNWRLDPRGAHGLDPFIARDVGAIEISVGPLDASYFLNVSNADARLYIDQLMLLKNRVDVAHWGQNEGSGWCLSRYPQNWEGAWQAVSVGCYPGVRYEAASQDWFPFDAK